MRKKNVKDIWPERKRKRVIKWTQYWTRMLSLEPVNIDWAFNTEPKDTDDEMRTVAMDIHSGFPYRHMLINVYPLCAEVNNRRLGQMVCHELMHYVVKPMSRNRLDPYEEYRDNEELVVDQLAMCFENLAYCLSEETKKKKRRK